MNFDEIWNDDGALSSCSRDDAEDFYNEGAQSQQAKIDLLEKELTETQAFLNKQNHIKQTKIDCMKVELDGVNERAMMMFNHKNAMVDKMQAKINELQKLRSLDEMEINQLAQANQVWRTKCDELQARIDDASNKIDFWVGGKNGDATHVAKSIGNILKGNKDEN